uniref:Retinoic acid-induced protein 1 n=2 Tax=Aceria tosichella TaxID=561515 RepID=A0A6G1SEI8_9ACAR
MPDGCNKVAGDQNVVCVLCHKICHCRGLGDLYGPYNIDFSTTSNAPSDRYKTITPKKSKYSLLNHSYAVKEIWIHEDCLVWSEGVHLVGNKILKMEETIKASFNHNCSVCKTKGATIGCSGKRCRRKFHYICGRDSKCQFDETNFTLKCDRCLANAEAQPSQ